MKSSLLLAGILLFLFLATADCRSGDSEPPKDRMKKEVPVAVEPFDRSPAASAASSADEGKPSAKVPPEQVRNKDGAVPVREKPATSPSLDLPSLEKRLRETKAIGVFTKITLKNQVDDLVNQFRDYHGGRVKTALAELRQRYDLLLLKLLSLLQDSDPALAHTIVSSREAIWSILIDPRKFKTI